MIAIATSPEDLADVTDDGIAIAPPGGAASSGDWGIAIADSIDEGTAGAAQAGVHGIAAVGEYGTAQAGGSGIVVCAWQDTSTVPPRRRLTIGYVGENGILPDTPYTADPATGALTAVTP